MRNPKSKSHEEARRQESEGVWKQLTGRVQEAWGALRDDDLDRFKGQRDQLIGKIQEMTGEARAEVEKKIDEWAEEIRYRFDGKR